ncbi:MAG: two-component regulator propeller domain-containing protein [Gallionella sp.]|nr:two-component regulator propeller domain-containing protein [Gallionella sp.]
MNLQRTFSIAVRAKATGWIRLIAGVCLALLALTAQAIQPPPLRFENLGNVLGRNSSATSIVQDAQGFIWLGALNGLFRYDGYEVVKYQNWPDDPDSLPADYVLTIFIDANEVMWIGTSNGLARFDRKSNKFKRFTFSSAASLPNIVHKISSDGKGGLWLATRGGLQHFNPNSGIFVEYKHDPSRPDSIATDNINTLVLDSKGGLWLATWPGGLDYLAPGASTFLHYRVDLSGNPNNAMNNVRTLLIDSKQRLWIGTETGIILWKIGTDWSKREQLESPVGAMAGRINSIYEAQNATIWLATHIGLLRWDEDSNKLLHYFHEADDPLSLPSNSVYAVYVDRSDIMWLAAASKLVRVDQANQGFRHAVLKDKQNSLREYIVLSLAGTNGGSLWVGAANGLSLVDTSTFRVIKRYDAGAKHAGPLNSNIIYSLYNERDGPLWVGTNVGLNRYEKAAGNFHSISFNDVASNKILSIAPGREGILWLGTGGGLIQYNPSSGSSRVFNHDPADPRSRSVNASFAVLEDRSGRVWVGGAMNGGGLDVLDRVSGKFKHYLHDPQKSDSLIDDHVYCLFEDQQGSLWVGTAKGLNKIVFKPDGSVGFKTVSNSKLAFVAIANIQDDTAGKLWVNANDGLFQLDQNTNKVTEYPDLNGIFSSVSARAVMRDDNGTIYFGNSTGLVSVSPKQVSLKTFAPQATIVDIALSNRSLHGYMPPKGVELDGGVLTPKALKLSWQNSTFSFKFSALHYADPLANRYAYQLEGFDKGFVNVDANNRWATYTNLDPGNYVFHLKASNNSGQWSETTLPVTISPPFWVTWWFRTLAVGLMLALATIAYRWRIRQLNRNALRLELLVQERSAEAVRLRDEAVAANNAKSEFLANMSHEIRTPMNSILGMAHLALNAEITAKSRNYIEKIHQSGIHLLRIIDEILDFSKIGAGKLRIEEVDFNLADMLGSVTILFVERARAKGLDFICNIDSGIPPDLCGDPLRLGQVLINYIGNAVKFTETGSIAVHAKKIDENENGVTVRFEVHDTGIGISDAEARLLFQPFQQVDSSTTRKYGGTGLGLVISKQLVELMKEGKLGMDSIAGKGSTFWFSVRLGRNCMQQAVTYQSSTSSPSVQQDKLEGAHILVAEDHPIGQEVITCVLENAGAVVSIANNGQEALDLLENNRFDCVLMDVQMPVMGGYEATRRIRANPAWAGIPVIAMTANASKDDCDQCLAAGMDDFVGKPFNPAQLFATLGKWLAKPKAIHRPFPSKKNWGGDPEILDLSVLAGWNYGDKPMMRGFVLKFLVSARQDVVKIEEMLKHNNLEGLGALGHYIKTPAMMVGAREFAGLCQLLEEFDEIKGSPEQAREIVQKMHLALDRINEQIANELA